MSVKSRSAGGVRESLIFCTPEDAHEFRASVERRIQQDVSRGVKRKKEVVASELARVFEQEGAGVTRVRDLLQHSPREHEEVQRLVDVAFSQDISVAIAQARSGEFFPHSIDMLHDALTDKLYDVIIINRMDIQHISPWSIMIFFVIFLGMVIAILAFMYSL